MWNWWGCCSCSMEWHTLSRVSGGILVLMLLSRAMLKSLLHSTAVLTGWHRGCTPQLIVSPGKCLPLLNACHTCFSHCGCSGRCLFPFKSMPHLFFRLQAMAGAGPMAGQTIATHQAGAYQADSAFQAAQPARGCCTTAHRAVSPGLRLGLLGAWATIA